ncbi:MAG: YdeI/OmpD-associated family protein, partial [Ignavibacteria bacterium]
MKIGKTLYISDRKKWRSWLAKHHDTANEIWLVYYKLHTGKPRIPYNDAVEEALCYGWIDSTVKKIDENKFVQRFTPRRSLSKWSESNLERIRRLIKQGKMTPVGLAKVKNLSGLVKSKDNPLETKRLVVPSDILKILKKDLKTWEYFQKFPETYKRIR